MHEGRQEGTETSGGTAVMSLRAPFLSSSRQEAVLTAVRAWEAQNVRTLREREARALQEQEQEQLLTYTREDAYNAVRGARSRGQSLGPFQEKKPW